METLKQFWVWYIALFSNADLKIRIAAWAATVATATFIITFILRPIFAYLNRELFKRVKVKAGISHQLITSVLGVNTGTPLLTCTVTNHDSKSIFIQNPKVLLSQAVDGEKIFGVASRSGTFPMKLEAGQQKTFEYNTANLNNQLLRFIKSSAKVSFIINTTTGKKFYSNKFTSKHILGHIEVAQNIN